MIDDELAAKIRITIQTPIKYSIILLNSDKMHNIIMAYSDMNTAFSRNLKILKRDQPKRTGPNQYVRVIITLLQLPVRRLTGIDYQHITANLGNISEDRIRSNLSKTKNIPPKALIFSDFCCTFAMSLMFLLVLICSTKVSEISDMAKS